MSKLARIITSVLIVVFGLVFIISGIHSIATKDLYDSTVTATVVDIQEEWDYSDPDESRLETTVYVDYEIDGVKYEHVESPTQNGNMQIGDTVELLYQSQDPSQISSQNITGGAAIFIAVGAIVVIGGCFATFKAIVKK